MYTELFTGIYKVLGGSILLFAFASLGFGQNIEVVTPDGKKVVLKPNKTWEYVVEKPVPIDPITQKDDTKITDITQLFIFATKNKTNLEKNGSETEKEYLSRLFKFVNETDFEGKKLKDSSVLFNADFKYNERLQEFSFSGYAVGQNYVLVKRVDNTEFKGRRLEVNFKMPLEKAIEVKNDLRVKIVGFPVGVPQELEFFATKIIIFNQKTKEIYAEIEGDRLSP